MYPRLRVDLEHLSANVKTVARLCRQRGISVTVITKCFTADPVIAQCYVDSGIAMLGDSRVKNLAKMKDISAQKWLIRPPMLCEIEDLVRYGDVSLNSEIETVKAISAEALRQNKIHKVILMVDLGDIREGYINEDDLIAAAIETEQLPGVELYGIGTNLTCFSFIHYDTDKMTQLARLRGKVSDAIGRPIEIVSGGNSATLDLMLTKGLPVGVDNLRLGESMLVGKERAKYQYLEGTFRDTFILECQIVELKEKPSLPWGEVGVDSYGRRPSFVDRGDKRIKAICAIGKQDFDVETTRPCDSGIIILGTSSDHLMLDVTDSENKYQVGDIIELELGYFSILRAFTSDYVEKVYINGKTV